LEELSENLHLMIKQEAENFKELAQSLWFCYGFLELEEISIKKGGEFLWENFSPLKFFDNINKIRHRLSNADKKIFEEKGLLFSESLLNTELEKRFNIPNRSDVDDAGWLKFSYGYYLHPEILDIEAQIDPNGKLPKELFKVLSLNCYALFKLYKYFFLLYRVEQIDPDKLFYDLYKRGDSIKQKSQFLIGYWTKARAAIYKPIKSAKIKTKIAEQNYETVRSLLLGKYNNKASIDFFSQAMKATARGERTIKDMVKKIRKELKKGKTDGIS